MIDALPNKQEIRGLWWLPEEPSQRWFGVLTLELGRYPVLEISLPVEQDEPKEIRGLTLLGCANEHEKITLVGASWTSQNHGQALRHICCEGFFALLGIHADDPRALRVGDVSFGATGLLEWTAMTGFKRRPRGGKEIAIEYERPERANFKVGDGLAGQISVLFGFSDKVGEQKISETPYFSVRATKESTALPEAIRRAEQLRRLLHFACLERVFFTQLSLVCQDGFLPRSVQVWGQSLREADYGRGTRRSWTFKLPDVRERLGDFIGEWLTFAETHAADLDLYDATVYQPLPNSIRLLAIAQALEGYYWVRYAQDASFKERIERLVRNHHEVLKAVIPEIGPFAERVKRMRNFFTHHKKKWLDDEQPYNGNEVAKFADWLQAIYQMNVLGELGIDYSACTAWNHLQGSSYFGAWD